MSILENLTPLAVCPQEDRLKRFYIVCLNEKTSPGAGKMVVAENIRQEEVAQRIVACVNACAGIPDTFLKPGIVAEQGIEAQQLIRKVDHFQQLAQHRSRSIDNLMNINGKQNTEIERLTSERDQLLAALVELRDQVCNATSRRPVNEAREAADIVIARVKGGAA